ncbi:MAG: LysR substrate-binding domain-containing protein [Paracoccaceae bacterium]
MNPPRRTLRQTLPSLHGLMVFEASARHLNFSKAADELAITQSAVSHAVRQLEEVLGHPLFLRENRALCLTTQGQRLFASVSRGFGSIAETVGDISAAEQKDTVVVSCSTIMATEWLLPHLPALRAAFPDLKVEVRCFDRDPDMMSHGIDVQLRLGDGIWPDYDTIRLWQEEIFAVASPAYLAAHPLTSLAGILDHRLILYVDPLRFRIGWAEWLRALGVDPSGRLPVTMQVNDSLVSLQAAEAGEGLALGWRITADRALAQGRIVRALPDSLATDRYFHILTPKAARPRRIVRQFCDWLAAAEGAPDSKG